MNIPKINAISAPTQNFKSNALTKTKNLIVAAAAATTMLGATQSAKAQQVYTDDWGGQYVTYQDYQKLQQKYEAAFADHYDKSYDIGLDFANKMKAVGQSAEVWEQPARQRYNGTLCLEALACFLIGGVVRFGYNVFKGVK